MAKSRKLSGADSMFSVPRASDTAFLTAPSCNSDTGIAPSRGLLGTPIVPLVGAVAYVLSQPDPFAAAGEINLNISDANFITTSPNDPTVALSIDTVDWSAIKWDVIKWDAIKWDSIKWDSIKWDSIRWDAIKWDSIRWDAIKWDSVGFDSVSQDFGNTAAVAEDSTEDLSASTTVVKDATAVVTPAGTTNVASQRHR